MALGLGGKKKAAKVVSPAKEAKAKKAAEAKVKKAEAKEAAKAAKAAAKGKKPMKANVPRSGPWPYGGIAAVIGICGFFALLVGGLWAYEFFNDKPDGMFHGFCGALMLGIIIAAIGGFNEEWGKIPRRVQMLSALPAAAQVASPVAPEPEMNVDPLKDVPKDPGVTLTDIDFEAL